MALTPTAGQFAVIKVTPSGGAQATLPGINWALSDMAKAKDVSNFRDGRVRTPTLPDSTLTFTLVWDSAANPTIAPNGVVLRGTYFVAALYTDPATTKPTTFNGIIDTANLKNDGVEGVVMYDISASQSGAATTYPVT